MTAAPSRRILVVDDEHTVAETLSLVFQSKGYNVRTACDAESALLLLQSFPADIVVCDIILPGMNGIEFATLMRKAYPNCRVILLSGNPKTEDVMRDAEAQGHTFELLVKPCHPSELLARVGTVPAPN